MSTEKELKLLIQAYSKVDVGFIQDRPESLKRYKVLMTKIINVAVQRGCPIQDALRWNKIIREEFTYAKSKDIYEEVMSFINIHQ